MEYGGGFMLKGPWGAAAGANITPDASGIGYYERESLHPEHAHGICKGEKTEFDHAFRRVCKLSDDELKAMFA